MIAIGGDVRFAASQVLEKRAGRRLSRHQPGGLPGVLRSGRTDGRRSARRSLPPAARCEAETLVPSLLIYRTLLEETASKQVVVSDASLRTGVLLDLAEPGGRLGAEDFEAPGLGERRRGRPQVPLRPAHGRHVADLADAAVRSAHGRAPADAARAPAARGLGAAPRHRHLRQPARASQALAVFTLGVADLRAVRRRNRDRRQHRALSSPRDAAAKPPVRTSRSIARIA